MSETGKVSAVNEVSIGTSLDGAHGAGVSSLLVLDPFEFSETGGTLQLDDETLTYLSWDEDESTIALAAPTASAHDDGAAVLVLPLTTEVVAAVTLGSGEAVTADVPHALRAYLPVGTSGGQTVVLADTEDGLLLTDVVKESPQFNGAAIDPNSVIPPKAMTDGIPPALSPTPTVAGFLGTLVVKWLPITNPDLVTYDVHVSTLSGFTPDATTLAGSTNGTLQYVRSLADGSTLDYEVPYFVKMVARDADGSAPASTEVPAQTTQVQLEDIAVGAVTAEKLEATLALLTVIQAGPLIEISAAGGTVDAPTGGIVVKDPANPTGTPLVRLHPLGCRFRGELVTDFLTVLQEAVVNSVLTLAGGSTTVLKNGVSNPPAPILAASRVEQVWPTIPAGFAQRGLHWDSTASRWLRLLVPTSGAVSARCRVEKITTAGVTDGYVTLGNVPGDEIDMNSVVRIGSYYFAIAKTADLGFWQVCRWTTAGVYSGQWTDDFYGYGAGRPSLGHNAARTTMYVTSALANTSPTIEVLYVDPTSIANPWTSGGGYSLPTGSSLGTMYCSYENFDFGTARFVVASGNNVHVFSGSMGSLTYSATDSFSIDSSPFNGGVAWNGSNFFSTHGGEILYRYSSYYPSAGEKWWAKYADTGSGTTTAGSPVSVGLAVPVRRYATATLRPAPTGVTGADLFVGYGTTTPGTFYKRAETISGRVFVLTGGKITTGSTTVPSSNTMGGSPATFTSETGGASIDGAGNAAFPRMTQAGQISIGAGTGTVTGSVALATDMGTAAYAILWGVSSTNLSAPTGSGRSASGFNYSVARTGAGTLYWTVMKNTQ